MDLGEQPPSELFPPFDEPGPDPVFPLRLWMCGECGLAQLADDMDVPEDPQGVQPEALTRQAADAMAQLDVGPGMPAGGTVAEFPSPHGGSWLPLLAEHRLVLPLAEQADVVVDCSFGLMHAHDQAAAMAERAAAVAPGGLLPPQTPVARVDRGAPGMERRPARALRLLLGAGDAHDDGRGGARGLRRVRGSRCTAARCSWRAGPVPAGGVARDPDEAGDRHRRARRGRCGRSRRRGPDRRLPAQRLAPGRAAQWPPRLRVPRGIAGGAAAAPRRRAP